MLEILEALGLICGGWILYMIGAGIYYFSRHMSRPEQPKKEGS